ncbi:MAG: YacL family protein, partial [Thalassolituus sp.]
MDYDFTYDDYGKSIIQLEMGQEATAVWLNSDVIGDKTTLL